VALTARRGRHQGPFFLFFLVHAGELCIIILRREQNPGKGPLQKNHTNPHQNLDIKNNKCTLYNSK
jgi:hypothetical protein